MRRSVTSLLAVLCLAVASSGVCLADDAEDVWDRVDHHFAKNGDVRIHYVTLGEGKPVLFVHGFPDFWYSFRHQMHTLASDYRTAAMDLRGYNRSDKPEGVEHYALPRILGDVEAVIDALGGKVTLVGHDWGGAIAWRFAMTRPEKLERLVILNLTHPKGYVAVVSDPTEAQRANTQYARNFAKSKPDGSPVPGFFLAVADRMGPVVGTRYREALGRSYYDGMLNYYRANYGPPWGGETPNVTVPVLQFHGLRDTAVDKDGLKGTWDWIDSDYTLVTIPSAGHFVQWEAAELVSQTMKWWLKARDDGAGQSRPLRRRRL